MRLSRPFLIRIRSTAPPGSPLRDYPEAHVVTTPHGPYLRSKRPCCYNTLSQLREREFVLQQKQQEKVYRSELTPVSFLRRNAYVFPDKVAIVHGERRYTYQQFEERVNRLSSRLRDAGLQKHDRV
ncbi:MAG: AMP-binding protein, partial [Actinomycetota bacterium]|nr:AMP-binding protein [Actinomycetota bacterium]